jgi:glycosyltransferase 2 family protein
MTDTAAPTRAVARRILLRTLQVCVVAVTCAFVVRTLYQNWHSVRQVEFRVSLWIGLSSMLLAFAYLAGRGLLWHRIVQRTVGEIPWRINVACWLASALGKYVPGKVFQFLGRVYVYRRHGVDASLVAVGFVVEMAALGVASALLFLAGALTARSTVPVELRWGAAFAAVLSLSGAHPRVLAFALRLRSRWFGVSPVPRTLRMRDNLADVVHMLACWALLGTGLWLLSSTLVRLPAAAIPQLTGAYALAGMVGIAVLVAPSGVGVRESALIVLLSPVLGPGVAAALALLARLWMTLAEVATALLGVYLLRRLHETLDTASSLGDPEAKTGGAPLD